MDQELRDFSNDAKLFNEMKEYLIQHLCSTLMQNKVVVPPEEVIVLMYPENYMNCDIQKEYDLDLNQFHYRFWREKLIRFIDRDSFEIFLKTWKRELGDEFFTGLKEHLDPKENAE